MKFKTDDRHYNFELLTKETIKLASDLDRKAFYGELISKEEEREFKEKLEEFGKEYNSLFKRE